MSLGSSVAYLAGSSRRWFEYRTKAGEYPPGPRGPMAAVDAVRAFMDPGFAADYYPKIVEKYGKVVLVPGPLGQFFVYIADPALHRQITMNFRDYPRAWLQQLFEGIAGTIISGEGTEQKRRRGLINPSLLKPVLGKYVPGVQEEIAKLFPHWDRHLTGDGLKITPELVALFSNISARLLAGGADIPEGMGLKIVNLIALFQKNPMGAEYKATKAYVFKTVGELLEQSATTDLGILSIYQREVAAERMTKEDAIAEVTGFFNASVETTANLLSWLTYFLARDPIRYQKVQAEAERVFNGRQSIEPQEVDQLEYAMLCVDEAARLRPAVWRQLRMVGKPGLTIVHEDKTFKLPYGAQVFNLVQSIQTDQEIWGQTANEFNPEVNMALVASKTVPEGAYAPFAQGIHLCPGMPFAKMEAALVIAMMSLRYSEISSPKNQKPVFGPILAYPSDAVITGHLR